MILIDPRRGSGELEPLFRKLRMPTRVEYLKYGDFAFAGNGPRGTSLVGVERKRVSEQIVGNTRWVADQLQGMVEHYDMPWLIVEGVWRPGDGGPSAPLVEHARGQWREQRFSYQGLDNYLNSLTMCTGVYVKRSGSDVETVAQVCDLYWLLDKKWEDHKSHFAFHTTPPPRVSFIRPGFVMRVAKEVRDIGWEKAVKVAIHFRNVRDMANAEIAEWEKIPGIGKKIARRAFDAFRGSSNEEEEK